MHVDKARLRRLLLNPNRVEHQTLFVTLLTVGENQEIFSVHDPIDHRLYNDLVSQFWVRNLLEFQSHSKMLRDDRTW